MIAVITRLLLRRALLAVPLVFAVVALTFFFIRLAPGDPAQILAGDAPTAEFLAQVRAEYGLDRPMWTQFLAFLVVCPLQRYQSASHSPAALASPWADRSGA